MEVTGSSSQEQAGGDCSKECSMCGDVGFSTELFQCKRCFYRWQHTYCSRLYPSVSWVCDWCFQADDAKPNIRASRTAKRKTMMMASSNSRPSSYSGSEVAEWSQYDALEFLLEVAQSASSDGLRETCVERQACSSKRTSARKCTSSGFSPKRQQRCGINDRSSLEKWQQFSKAKLPTVTPAASAASKGIGGRRYKLLSDVLC